MKILSVSTATNNLSVALNQDDTIVVEKNEIDERNHSEHLDPLIKDILESNHLELKDIDRFAVALGPGSYTGLRIGVTTVKMFASILQKEVVGVSTLQALAASCNATQTLIVAGLDARNDNFFAGAYVNADKQLTNIIADGHYHIDILLTKIKNYFVDHKLKQVIFVGTGFEKQAELIKNIDVPYSYGSMQQNQIHAGLIGRLANSEKTVEPDKLLPNYLRRTQAEVDWHKKTGQDFGPDSKYVEEV
ncbi:MULTISPECIES: tRNA (adenosine(37)-N6)-threonylcarbamoyltransferase complex dimerization subunit type 1 TsaB [unclassified Lactobacillus]|uniref:tRNA (adenosine(37)-N6)-threonylcarbamoyltransferase complex dimerization subunit type 1 TsaB n=1 Tax=unclassified Lactobacillus TaxID=2620435 RepID=UPI000EFC7EAC|nr:MULTISPECIES: tRNA (adenosine(37)-N6)-threonylcarbamoyltransferase complex dimerization subunit type 1 TsaB [unclassified Lactobacillus]RMC38392.1 tRNA (adenosine(37)-N6)-threonylcarbamoyltransferase complex dimerization subunit type 1 TsaB [Lactobacillus sp. ESL0237]RMC43200.1 tRNA (adenosine(37)-N6)-threonylcarbamoyltransferase complex dimerization subunit type 1 TsaB [Lactobacillus sp. ESL0234]RMC44227.1 tRNA (adenosine(37)-N6)-threonylcarbamoyltransferase complex dimerization subunit type